MFRKLAWDRFLSNCTVCIRSQIFPDVTHCSHKDLILGLDLHQHILRRAYSGVCFGGVEVCTMHCPVLPYFYHERSVS